MLVAPWGLGDRATADPAPTIDTPADSASGSGADARTPIASAESIPGFDAMGGAQAMPAMPDIAGIGSGGGLAATGLAMAASGRSLDCMTLAIAYEAGNQPVAGQEAVGQVVLNRLRDPRFPKTVCSVVFAGSERATGCQFTFTCDGSIRRRLSTSTLLTARVVAQAVMHGDVPDRVSGATHYHADYVLPYWAGSGRAVARIGAHIFYRMPGDIAASTMMASAAMTPAVATSFAEAAPALMLSPSRHPARRGKGRRGAALLTLAGTEATTNTGGGPFSPWGLAVAGATTTRSACCPR